MNYLAHAYLSFGIPAITVGNLISDFVKGKQKLSYPPEIQRGIVLHRAIDSFTDTHPVTRQAKVYFKEPYGGYAGPLVDRRGPMGPMRLILRPLLKRPMRNWAKIRPFFRNVLPGFSSICVARTGYTITGIRKAFSTPLPVWRGVRPIWVARMPPGTSSRSIIPSCRDVTRPFFRNCRNTP
jgi:hypothetical protein